MGRIALPTRTSRNFKAQYLATRVIFKHIKNLLAMVETIINQRHCLPFAPFLSLYLDGAFAYDRLGKRVENVQQEELDTQNFTISVFGLDFHEKVICHGPSDRERGKKTVQSVLGSALP
jgi:hypothetical protein